MKSLVGNYKNLNYKDFSIKITLKSAEELKMNYL